MDKMVIIMDPKTFYSGKKVFITGHTGFKGSWMCKVLNCLGSKVAGCSLSYPTPTNLYTISGVEQSVESHLGDIRDLESLKEMVMRFKPDIVIHMAAQPLVSVGYSDPVLTYSTNVMGTVNILESIRACDSVKSFVNVTTDKVYRNNEWMWGYRENEYLDGYDPYSNSKSCSELVTSSYRNSFLKQKIATSTARAGNVIGGGDFTDPRIVPDCVRAALSENIMQLRNPGSIRPYQHVLEPVFAYLMIAAKQFEDHSLEGSYNIGPSEEGCVSNEDLVKLFGKKWGPDFSYEITVKQNEPHEANYLKLDNSKIKTVFNWSPKWNISDAVEKTVEWTKAYVDGCPNECMDLQIDIVDINDNHFDSYTEKTARKEILDLVVQYCDKFHNKKQYSKGQRIPYSGRQYDSSEMSKLVDAALDFWLTSGRYTIEFEEGLANFLGISYCSLVNSGSSANLIAFMTLTSPLLGERRINPGDEVITVACGFPTTVAPIIQYGAVPVFVDIKVPQYNIDISKLNEALSEKTKAIMVAHTLGNPFDIQAVKKFCDDNNLWLIEDNCDALGSKYMYGGELKYTGTVGDIGTSSFYPPHHITTGEGGAVYTNNPLLHKIIRSMRDWGRDCICPSGKDDTCGHRFTMQFGQLPLGYDHKYVYSHFGYNLKATDLQASIGCAQLDKLPEFIMRRRNNFEKLLKGVSSLKEQFILPEPLEGSKPSWFGFILTCRDGIDKNHIVNYLEARGIQTRMLFAGNIVRHPCFDIIRDDPLKYRVVGGLDNTDNVVDNSFWVGVYPGMTDDMIEYMIDAILESVK